MNIYYDTRHGIRTKEEIVEEIEEMVKKIRSGEGNEAKKSVKSHLAYLDFAESFLKRVKETRLPELVTEGWEFSAEITENAACLFLEYVENEEGVKKLDDSYICTIRELFELIDMQPKMLTVEDYAQLHEVNVGTVRQWIRRGKIRKAKKIGKEWRIPKFVEPLTGKYIDGLFFWHGEKLCDLPDEYSYLNDFDELGITQIDSDTYKVGLESFAKNGKRRMFTINAKEREKLELFLISNPFIQCIDGGIDFDEFEKNLEQFT